MSNYREIHPHAKYQQIDPQPFNPQPSPPNRPEPYNQTYQNLTICQQELLKIKRNLFFFRMNSQIQEELQGRQLNQYGDMQSCEGLNNGFSSQYVLINIQGNHSNPQFFKLGGKGKYFNYGSQVGICIPISCQSSDIRTLIPYYQHLALTQGYMAQNLSVSFEFPTLIANRRSAKSQPVLFVVYMFLSVLLSVCCLGTIIEVTQLGNRSDIVFRDNSKITKFSTWNKKLLLQKEYWTFFFLAFSFIRNNLFILNRRHKASEYKMATKKPQRLVDNLDVIDGFKSLNMIIICFAFTFKIVQYQIVQNNREFTEQVQNTFFFQIFISGSAQTAIEIGFFLSGLLQAVSFLTYTKSDPCLKKIILYQIKRLFKVIPFYYTTIFLITYGISLYNRGPHQHFFDKLLLPCKTPITLLANLLFFNNFYPNMGSSEDICLPWTWFVSTYIQLSLLTPYWDQVFTKPWYMYNIQIGLGVIFGIFYKRHIDIIQRLEQGGRYENSIWHTILTYFKKKYVIRLALNLIGCSLWIGINHIVSYDYNVNKSNWTLTAEIIYGLIRGPISITGIGILLLPMLLSKFRVMRRVLRMRGFVILSHLSFGIYLWYPVIVLTYLYQTHSMIQITYLNILYYFLGSFFISIVVSYILYMMIQAPIIALLNIYREAFEVRSGVKKIKFKYEFVSS
eukprot:403369665